MRSSPRRSLLIAAAFLSALGCSERLPDTLAIGASAPAFELPGTDGRTHTLDEYAKSPVLAVVFTCNHCPAAQLYEQRLQELYRDYRERGVAFVAINPDGPKTVMLKDLAYSDVPDSLAGMTERARHRKLEYPYLYDGDAQAATEAYKVVATPQVFVFDAERKLRYVGRIDDNLEAARVKVRNVRAAIDALLGNQPIRVTVTVPIGCPVRRIGQTSHVSDEQAEIEKTPVSLQAAGATELAALRANRSGKLTVVNFWATWCGPCIVEFPALQTIARTYRLRGLEFVTVSIDVPAGRPDVLKLLQERRASTKNYMFATDDTTGLQEAFDPALPASVPFTLLLAPNGDVLHQQHGEVEFLGLRRAILANLPDDVESPGFQKHWAN